MTASILQRIHALAETPPPLLKQLASVARKLGSTDSVVEKAHGVAGIVKGLSPAEQERVVAALEVLAK